MRKRFSAAWTAYRHVAAVKGLLEWLGVWKYGVFAGGLAVGALTGWVWVLPLGARILVSLAGLVLFLFFAGFGLVLFREYGRPASLLQPVEPLVAGPLHRATLLNFLPPPPEELLETECYVEWSLQSSQSKLVASVWNITPRSIPCMLSLAKLQRWSEIQQAFVDHSPVHLYDFKIIRTMIAPEAPISVELVRHNGDNFCILGLERDRTQCGYRQAKWKCVLSLELGTKKRFQDLCFEWSTEGLVARLCHDLALPAGDGRAPQHASQAGRE